MCVCIHLYRPQVLYSYFDNENPKLQLIESVIRNFLNSNSYLLLLMHCHFVINALSFRY